MKTTPESITRLEPNQVFVFGSNLAGRHGKGAALLAAIQFGAIEGQGVGLMGQSYGIATKGHRLEVLPLSDIAAQIVTLLREAAAHPELEFLVTKIGCGLAGYSVEEMRRCFAGKVIPPNVWLPREFQPEAASPTPLPTIAIIGTAGRPPTEHLLTNESFGRMCAEVRRCATKITGGAPGAPSPGALPLPTTALSNCFFSGSPRNCTSSSRPSSWGTACFSTQASRTGRPTPAEH